MDLNLIRIGVTLLSFALFIGIVAWAWSRRSQAGFAEAEQLPFMDEAPAAPAVAQREPTAQRPSGIRS